MPVVPGAKVRAPSGKLLGGSGMLWPAFGEAGDWVTPCAIDGAAPRKSDRTAKAHPDKTFMVKLRISAAPMPPCSDNIRRLFKTHAMSLSAHARVA